MQHRVVLEGKRELVVELGMEELRQRKRRKKWRKPIMMRRKRKKWRKKKKYMMINERKEINLSFLRKERMTMTWVSGTTCMVRWNYSRITGNAIRLSSFRTSLLRSRKSSIRSLIR